MTKFKPEKFRLHVAHRTANQLKLESGVANKNDALRKYRQDFFQLPSLVSLVIVLGIIGRVAARIDFSTKPSDLDAQALFYIFGFTAIVVILGMIFLFLAADFYICWILDRRSNELIHITKNFLSGQKKRYPLSDFQAIKILPPKETFLGQYVLTIVRKDKSWLALERQAIDKKADSDLAAQRYQDLAKTICEFMRWPIVS